MTRKTICSGGFIYHNGKFLLGRRALQKKWAAGLWDIVGGHAEKDEPPFEALIREAEEELGIVITAASLMTVIDVPDNSKRGFFEYHIYWVDEYSGEPKNCSAEHTEIRWFDREEFEQLHLADQSYLKLIDDWLLA